jgi:TPR repeat protein
VTKRLAATGVRLACAAASLAVLAVAGGSPAGAAPELAGPDSAVQALGRWVPRALSDDALAAYKLGHAYLDGAKLPEDRIEGARWLARAAAAGHGAAQLDLAVLYAKGLGLPQDYVRSYAWFELAAANLEPGPRRERALEMRDMMAAFMTPEQRAGARRLAERWKADANR